MSDTQLLLAALVLTVVIAVLAVRAYRESQARRDSGKPTDAYVRLAVALLAGLGIIVVVAVLR